MTTTRYSIVPTLKSVSPVVAGQTYIGFVRIAVDIAGRNCYAKFYWYDSNYKFLSNSTLSSPVTSIGAFAWQGISTSAVAPSNAAYAGIVPEIQDPTGGDTCEFYVDRHKITTSTLNIAGPRAWQPPRQVNVALQPNAVNEMQNPAFGDATNPLWGWRPSGTKTTISLNSSVALHDGNSMDVAMSGILPGDVVNQLCFGGHTINSTALYPGSEIAKPPITSLLPDTDYTISLWVKPIIGYLPIRISFNDGFGEYVGTATPVTNVWQYPSQWRRISVAMHTSPSNTGSGRISVGYFASDLNAYSVSVDPTAAGQTTWTPWTNPPAHYRGIWQSSASYEAGDVVSISSTTVPSTTAFFATALSANTAVSPTADTGQVTWQRFNLYQTDTIGVTTTTVTATPFYIDSYWQNGSRYRGDKLGLGVEYPVGSGTTYCMAAPSAIFGSGASPMENHEFLVDEVLVAKGSSLIDFFDGDIPSPDYLWEGARYDSGSFYYRNRRTGQERLERIIGDYTPYGTPIQIQYSQGAVSNLWST